mgnify:CR=1 FL=1
MLASLLGVALVPSCSGRRNRDVEETTGAETVAEVAAPRSVAVGTPSVVGAGSIRSLDAGGGSLPAGWENTPRNNACPCGSGKKFKKCHGANL